MSIRASQTFVTFLSLCLAANAYNLCTARAQPGVKTCATPTEVTDAKFKPGQIWKVLGRDAEPNLNVTILKVESTKKMGTFVHVRIDNAMMRSCPGYPDWESLEHAPISRAALEKSIIELVRTGAPIPDFSEGYKNWLSACGGVYSITVAEILTLNEKTARANLGCS